MKEASYTDGHGHYHHDWMVNTDSRACYAGLTGSSFIAGQHKGFHL
jgi:hypothetical protein